MGQATVEMDSAAPPMDLAVWGELMTRERAIEVGRIILAGTIVLLFWLEYLPLWCLWAGVSVGLYPLVRTGIRDLLHEGKVGTEMFVTFATIIAVLGGEAIAGAVLMVIILMAEFIAELNTDRARASIRALIGSVPQVATVRSDGAERAVPIDQLRIGDIVLVRAGDKVPVDGRILAGDGSINEAPITGESVPRDKAAGDDVFAGSVLESGAVDVRMEKAGEDTTFARIVKLVEQAEESQAPVQRLADRVAAWLIPFMLIFLVIVYLLTLDVRKVVTLMVFTSPAELGLATPMVMIAAIARAARGGILIKGGAHLEALAKIDAVVFDKTGTLTIGKPAVQAVESLAEAMGEREMLRLASAADRRSAHPLARAVVDHAAGKGIDYPEPQAFESIRGRGVKATVEGRAVLVGNEALLEDHRIKPPAGRGRKGMTTLFVAVDGQAVGLIHVADQVRPGARETVAKLRASGVKHIAMLTGDNRTAAEAIAEQVGLDEVFPDLLPEQKVKAVQALQGHPHRVAMIGDGVNDAPALARADIGIAMGGGGTRVALEAADIALMTDDLSKIVLGRAIALRAYRTIQENLIFGVGVVHVLGIIAALMGWIGPIQAAFLHLGPDLLVFLNSVKLLHVRIDT